MDKYYGFDLGDAESAIAVLEKEDKQEPRILTLRDAQSFITAYARCEDGRTLIGEEACYAANTLNFSLRFKSRFLTQAGAAKDVERFAAAVLSALEEEERHAGEDCCFYIGCPAGWDKAARERYRRIFEDAGYPPVRIISESRAAMICACQSRHFQVGYDILSKPVLVVDIGSSTTDFAYIDQGHEQELKTAGEVALGGGIMDELLLEEAVQAAPDEDRKRIRQLFSESSAWKNYCEFAARRLKERYFSDEEYWRDQECIHLLHMDYDGPLNLTLKIDPAIAARLIDGPAPQLNGRSFRAVFEESLQSIRTHLGEKIPELIFLTGGVSKMEPVGSWCRGTFPESAVITGAQPEFSVARGLAWSGRIDEDMREFRLEVDRLIESDAVERIVDRHIDDLYRKTVDTLVTPILEEVALPVFDRWRSGEIRCLADIDQVLHDEIEQWLHSGQAQEYLVRPITAWLRPVSYDIEEYTMPICIRHNIPYKALSLNSYLSLSDINIEVDARNVFAVEELTWLVNTLITIVAGLLCGGSGIALISSGLSGLVAGSMLSLAILLLGKEKMQDAFMHMNLPLPVRRIVSRSYFENRLEKLSSEVRQNFYDNLEKEKNEEITRRMSDEISAQIEQCLSRMAEVVEIPLG